MSWVRIFRRRYWDDERARELEAYLAEEIDDNLARGMTLEQARRAAHVKLGNPTRIREEIYEMNPLTLLESAWHDLRYGARLLRRAPGFAAVAILSLALGIGANTAIFQLLDAVQFRTLPVKAPEQLVEIRPTSDLRWGNITGRRARATNAMWEEIRNGHSAFEGVFAWGVNRFNLSTGGESRFIDGLWVSGEFFDVLGVGPYRGRLLAARDDVAGCGSPAAVISYPFWQREYGGAPSAVGGTIRLDGHPFEIVGVTPPAFFGIEAGRSFDVAVPICSEPIVEPARNAVGKRYYWWLDVMGRLGPGVTLEQANAQLVAMSPALFRATVAPQFPQPDVKAFLSSILAARPASTGVSELRGEFQQPLWILFAVAALVLIVACANLANLLLARATAREREIAVRLAIGASRARLVRQLLAESLLLTAVGAAAGVAIAQSLSRFLVAFISTDASRLFFDLQADWRVLGFTTALAVATCLLFGLAPALRATRQRVALGMRTGRGITDGGTRLGLRRVLVVVQVALSLVLIIGGLLFVRTVRNLASVDPGLRISDVTIADFDARGARVPPSEQPQFARALRQRIAAIPGVLGVADAAIEPLSGSIWNDRAVVGSVRTVTNENHVSPGFFRLLDTPFVAGRDFTERDGPGAPWVAIVNESFAHAILNTTDPIGRTFRLEVSPGEPDPTYEVVGLVRDTRYADVREPVGPIAYFPEDQAPAPDDVLTGVQVFARSTLPLSTLAPAITAAAREVSPAMLVSYRSLGTDVERTFLRERLMATLSGFFAALAALLAVIGLYGVMSFVVLRRRNEIGIRLALGAEAGRVRWMVLRDAGVLLAAGLTMGAVLALVAARWAASLLYGLKPWDPATLAAAAGALATVALLATWVPAHRASRIDPTVALREP